MLSAVVVDSIVSEDRVSRDNATLINVLKELEKSVFPHTFPPY